MRTFFSHSFNDRPRFVPERGRVEEVKIQTRIYHFPANQNARQFKETAYTYEMKALPSCAMVSLLIIFITRSIKYLQKPEKRLSVRVINFIKFEKYVALVEICQLIYVELNRFNLLVACLVIRYHIPSICAIAGCNFELL